MLSVIIPTLNAGKYLPRLLPKLSGQVDDIVISDGGSVDDTLTVALSYNVRLAAGCSGRGWQLARGARWASLQTGDNDWLLFLHADTVLPDDWLEAVNEHIQDMPSKAAYFGLKLDAKGVRPRLLEFFVKLRSSLLALPYGDQGLLISRALYNEAGGFPDWDLFEDVAIIRALGRRRLRRLPAQLTTSAAQYQQHGYFGRGLRNLSLLLRFSFGADPAKLKDIYYK